MAVKPMLAGAINTPLTELPYPLYASPKLDGIRALIVDNVPVSRRLLTIPNRSIQEALSHPAYSHLDGELIVGPSTASNAYTRTLSGVMTEGGTPQVSFWVFDQWNRRHTFETLTSRRTSGHYASDNVFVRWLKQTLINNAEELADYEQRLINMGYEGVMLRKPDSLYKFGRSTKNEFHLMKLKRFEDSEAIVLDIVEQNRNMNEATINNLGRSKRSSHKANKIGKGTTGALRVRDLFTRVEFEIGTGMDDMERAEFWANPPVGQIVKYKFQPAGVKDKPRFPVFVGMRKD